MDAKYSKIIVRDGNGNLIQLLPEVKVATTIDINSTLPVTSSAVAAYGSEILSGIVKEVQYSTVEPTAANTEALDNGSLIFWEQTPAQAAEWIPVYLVGNQTITGAKTFTATISGSIDGNAATATRASQDASGNDIASTYATKSEMPVAYVGATSSSAGTAGLVPAATSAERDRYLRGDGTWAELTLPSDYVGATSNANGVHGLVPAATSAEKDKYLKGDGTWGEIILPQGATAAELSAGTETASKTVSPKVIHDYVADEVASGVAGLVNSAPSTLDTLSELASALGNDPNFATTIASTIGGKLDASSANYIKSLSISGNTITYTKGDNTTGTLTTQDISGKADKATTISGYGILDAKIESGTITLGSSTITPLTAASTLDASKLSGTASINTTGNASTATKATQDGSGNVITTTYATKSELPADYVGATSNANGVHGLVPAATSSKKDCFLCGDGTWDAIAGMTNAQIDTAMANVGYVGDIDPSLLTSITNAEIDALFA